MSLTPAQKSDINFKKLGTDKATTSPLTSFFEEAVNSRKAVFTSDIWAESDSIPATAMAVPTIVEQVTTLALQHIPGSNSLSFTHATLKDVIPFNFGDGSSYIYQLETDGGANIPFGLNDWYLDPEGGVLTFFAGFPSGVSPTLPPKISCYKYIGTKGAAGGGVSAFLDLTDVTDSNYTGKVDYVPMVVGSGLTLTELSLGKNSDFPSSYSGSGDNLLKVNSGGTGVEFLSITGNNKYVGSNGSGSVGVYDLPSGVTTLLGLTDIADTNYTGKSGQVLVVNGGETGMNLVAPEFSKWTIDTDVIKPTSGSITTLGIDSSGETLRITQNAGNVTYDSSQLQQFYITGSLRLKIEDSGLTYRPATGGYRALFKDEAGSDAVRFWMSATQTQVQIITGGQVSHNLRSGSNDSYLYAPGTTGRVGIGSTSPTEKLSVFGNIGIETEDAVSGDATKFNYLKLQSSFYNTSASGGPASQDVLLYIKNVPTQSLGNPAVSTSNFSISRLGTSTTVNNDLLRIDTSLSHYVFGASNTVTSPQSTFIFGTSCQGTTGVNQYAFGKVLKISGTDTFMTGSGYSAYTETRGGMRGHIFSVTAASRRVNFEYGINIPMRLLPQQARSTGLQFDNQGFHLISSYWDGAASQDITGYINHIITSQPSGEGALTLGNQNNDKSFMIDANNAIRINEQLHGLSLLTAPSTTALNVYSIPGSSDEMVKFIQPTGTTNNRVALVNDINSKLTFELRGSTASDPGAAKITLSGAGELRLEPPANFNLRIVLPAGTGNLIVDRIGGSTETLNTV